MSSPLLLAALLLFSWPSLWAPGPAANQSGNRAFRKGDYDRALAEYRRAQGVLPGERLLTYNSGTALLGGQKPEDAVQSLMSAAADPRREVQSRALYNAGLALAASDKLEEALGTFRQSILADPGNLDAKFNYELTKRRLQQQQQQQQENEKNKKDQKDQKQDDKKDQKQDQEQSKDKEQQNGESDPSDQQQQQKPEEQKPSEGEQPPPEDPASADSAAAQPVGLLNRQEAERLLDALKDSEVKQLKERLRSRRKKNVDKDW